MWIDPHETGLYLGQCAQYCGTQHAKMLLRVYVQPREEFDRWIQEQEQPARRVVIRIRRDGRSSRRPPVSIATPSQARWPMAASVRT